MSVNPERIKGALSNLLYEIRGADNKVWSVDKARVSYFRPVMTDNRNNIPLWVVSVDNTVDNLTYYVDRFHVLMNGDYSLFFKVPGDVIVGRCGCVGCNNSAGWVMKSNLSAYTKTDGRVCLLSPDLIPISEGYCLEGGEQLEIDGAFIMVPGKFGSGKDIFLGDDMLGFFTTSDLSRLPKRR